MQKENTYDHEPFMLFLGQATKQNSTLHTTLWSGKSMQLSLMSILHDNDATMEPPAAFDRLICVEQGRGLILIGEVADDCDTQRYLNPGNAILIPSGQWHKLINVSNTPLKVYCVSAPASYPEAESIINPETPSPNTPQ